MVKTIGMMSTSDVQIVGLEELDMFDEQRNVLRLLAAKYAQRMFKRVHNGGSLVVHIKEWERDGAQHRYEVKSIFACPSTTMSAEASGWDVVTSLKETLLALDGQLVKLHAKPKHVMTQFASAITSSEKLDKALRAIDTTQGYLQG